jgi:uncharacterized protein YjgD (DUF1641 family)
MDDTRLSNQPPPDELSRLAQAAQEALTDGIVERLATTGANALELLDRFNDDGTRAALNATIDRLTELHKVGALDTLFDTVMLVHAARNAATDNVVERLFTLVEQLINTLATEDMAILAGNMREALAEAALETKDLKPRPGILSARSLIVKPETQQGLAFLLAFAEKLRQRTAGTSAA